MPSGLYVKPDGIIAGTPTRVESKTIKFQVMDSLRNYGTKTLTLATKASASAPSAPTLTSPPDGRDPFPIDSTLVWASSSGATKYHLQVDSVSNSFGAMRYNDSTLTGTTQALTGMSNSKTYYWRVRAGNTVGWSAYSSTWSFTTAAAASNPTLSNDTTYYSNWASDPELPLLVSNTSNRLMIACVYRGSEGKCDSMVWVVSSTRQKLTWVDSVDGNPTRQDVYRMIAPTVGSGTLTAYYAGDSQSAGWIQVWSNIDQTTPLGTAEDSTSGWGTAASVSPTVASGDTVIAAATWSQAGGVSARGAGQTMRQYRMNTSGTPGFVVDTRSASSTTAQFNWTITVSDFNTFGIALKKAP
jgi:hypothetical protein